MYTLAVYVLKGLFWIVGGRFKVVNKHLLPQNEPCVVVCNHRSFFDVIYLGIGIWPVHIHYMAKKELFENRFLNWLFTSLHAFPVDRENPGPSVIKTPLKLLKEGKAVGIFPSGRRTSENVGLKKGASTIAIMAKVPVVPCHYEGPQTLKEWVSRKSIVLTIGEPIAPPEHLKSRDEKNDYLLEEIEKRIYK
ncbi:MAG: lysophospholipid acyltransferase family protein [Bacilli bacterium]